MTAGRIAAALAAALVASPAAAFVRTEDASTGVELSWRVPVVTFKVNGPPAASTSPSCAATPQADPAVDATRAGFAAWEQSCSSLRLVYGGPSDEIRVGLGGTAENVVVFREGWCSAVAEATAHPCFDDPKVDCGGIFNCFEDRSAGDRGIVALTSVLYDQRNGRIMDADIEVNGWDGADGGLPILASTQEDPAHGWYFTCGAPTGDLCVDYGEAGCDFIDLQNTLTHEAGHFVGLAHAPDASTTMFATTGPGDVEKRTLAADDIAGVCAIYPQADDDDGGCASAGGGGGLALLLAAAALARWPRRRASPPVSRGPGAP